MKGNTILILSAPMMCVAKKSDTVAQLLGNASFCVVLLRSSSEPRLQIV